TEAYPGGSDSLNHAAGEREARVHDRSPEEARADRASFTAPDSPGTITTRQGRPAPLSAHGDAGQDESLLRSWCCGAPTVPGPGSGPRGMAVRAAGGAEGSRIRGEERKEEITPVLCLVLPPVACRRLPL